MTRQSLDRRSISVARLTGWITLAVFLAGWAAVVPVMWFAEADRLWIGVVIGGGALLASFLFVHATVWPALSYRHAWYVHDDIGIEIGRGVIFRRVTLVPRSRVQHTDVTQGPIERRFGLGTLVIHTAGTEFATVSLPGLAHETAMTLRDALLPKDGADAV